MQKAHPRQYIPVVQSDWPQAKTPALIKTWLPLCLNGCSWCSTWGPGDRRAPGQWGAAPAWRRTKKSMWPGPASPGRPPTATHREMQRREKTCWKKKLQSKKMNRYNCIEMQHLYLNSPVCRQCELTIFIWQPSMRSIERNLMKGKYKIKSLY